MFSTSSTVSFTTNFFPLVRVMVVSGNASALSMYKQLSENVLPFNLVSFIKFIQDRHDFHHPVLYLPCNLLSFQVHKLLKDFIRSGDDSGVRLETALCRNHFCKLF